ncbi:MAG: glutamate racemase [Candidatus Pacebacteria bacterium]|nr:glutamate racemase [Candidatus Paceibacterota bacterium]PIR59888.1 MAG: glutamate racemase [Candidatus Pacebacteria bacterium CG10_big_fil_rev_8_21_14_0_10_44_54]
MQVGLIDSGIGGFSILHAAQQHLPELAYVYLADQEHFPYSKQTEAKLRKLATKHAKILTEQFHCEIIVLACNTLSVSALATLRNEFPKSTFVGTVPPVKVAAETLGSNNILVLATERTAASTYLQELLQNNRGPSWTVVGTTKLVESIENNDQAKVLETLKALYEQHKNTQFSGLVFGCTHFPLVQEKIQAFWPNAHFFTPSNGVVKQLEMLVLQQNSARHLTRTVFLTTPGYKPSRELRERFLTFSLGS